MRRSLRVVWLMTAVSLGCGRTGVGRIPRDGDSPEVFDRTEALAREVAWTGDLAIRPDGVEVAADGPTCGATLASTRQVPVVELLVDTSEAMGDLVPGTGKSRWQLTKEALEQVISNLTPASPAVGLTFFPHPDDCSLVPPSVPAVPFTEAARVRLLSALESVSAPAGARTTAAAFAAAQADATGKAFPNGLVLGPAVLVWLTAGVPLSSCGPSGDPALGLEGQVRSAFAAGLPTCVFALPGAGGTRDMLINVAKLGAGLSDPLDAEARAYGFQDCDQVTDPVSCLATGIRCVLDLGLPSDGGCDIRVPNLSPSCSIPLWAVPNSVDLDSAQVSITSGTASPRDVPRVNCLSAGADGWDFAPASAGKALILCGPSCSDFLGAWSYAINFGCKED